MISMQGSCRLAAVVVATVALIAPTSLHAAFNNGDIAAVNQSNIEIYDANLNYQYDIAGPAAGMMIQGDMAGNLWAAYIDAGTGKAALRKYTDSTTFTDHVANSFSAVTDDVWGIAYANGKVYVGYSQTSEIPFDFDNDTNNDVLQHNRIATFDVNSGTWGGDGFLTTGWPSAAGTFNTLNNDFNPLRSNASNRHALAAVTNSGSGEVEIVYLYATGNYVFYQPDALPAGNNPPYGDLNALNSPHGSNTGNARNMDTMPDGYTVVFGGFTNSSEVTAIDFFDGTNNASTDADFDNPVNGLVALADGRLVYTLWSGAGTTFAVLDNPTDLTATLIVGNNQNGFLTGSEQLTQILIPEPASTALVVIGSGLMLIRSRRRRC